LSNYIALNNINTDNFVLDIISKDKLLNTLLPNKDTSLEKIINGQDKINTFKLKININEIKSIEAAKKPISIIELDSYGFAANESINNALQYSKTDVKNNYFNSIDNINSKFESNSSILEESIENINNINNTDNTD